MSNRRPRCVAITFAKNGAPRACGAYTGGKEYCPGHDAMFAMLQDRAAAKAASR